MVALDKKIICSQLTSLKEKLIKKVYDIEVQTQDGRLSNHLKEKLLERKNELKERLLEVEYLMQKIEV